MTNNHENTYNINSDIIPIVKVYISSKNDPANHIKEILQNPDTLFSVKQILNECNICALVIRWDKFRPQPDPNDPKILLRYYVLPDREPIDVLDLAKLMSKLKRLFNQNEKLHELLARRSIIDENPIAGLPSLFSLEKYPDTIENNPFLEIVNELNALEKSNQFDK